MQTKVKPVPDRYHSVTPYLFIKDAARAIEFYKSAFGAAEEMRMEAPGGKIGHAELRIGDSLVMLADEFPEMNAHSPQTIGGSPVMIHLYVENVDTVVAKAIELGAKTLQPIKDQFYGDRSGSIIDPFGHLWNIATHKEDLSPEEMKQRAAKAMAEMPK